MNHGKGIIIGGGIGGLTTGVALSQAGEDIAVYEAAPELKEVGAGIWMAANAMQVFDRLGLAEDVMAAGEQIRSIQLRYYDMSIISNSDLTNSIKKFGFATTAIHRARLVKTIAKHLPVGSLHLGKRLKMVEQQSDKVIAHFEDGSTVEGDYLIGADGIHSATRQAFLPKSPTRYSGQTCWRGIAKADYSILNGHQAAEIWGKRCRFGFSVIGEGEIYWFACEDAPKGGQQAQAEIKPYLQELFKNFADPVAPIIEHTPTQYAIRNDLIDLPPLPTWSDRRVSLMGDAAHATTPNLGQGAGQAIEDAWCLGCLFGTDRSVETIFQDFYHLRHKKANEIISRSFNVGKIAHLRYGKRLRNLFFRSMPPALMEQQFDDLYSILTKEEIIG